MIDEIVQIMWAKQNPDVPWDKAASDPALTTLRNVVVGVLTAASQLPDTALKAKMASPQRQWASVIWRALLQEGLADV